MRIDERAADDYVLPMQALLPDGAAWRWQSGGFGYQLILATAQELARVNAATQAVLDRAIEMHRPAVANYHIDAYRLVANRALAGVAETMPRKMFGIGSRIGDRLWSHAGAATTFPVPLVQVDHLLGPCRIGSRIGDRLWGHRSRYYLRVRYYRSVVDPRVLWDALTEFKQAHIFLWFEDITGFGGEVSYASN